MKVKTLRGITLAVVTIGIAGACRSESAAPQTPQQVAQSLLDADRDFAQMAQQSNWSAAFDTMLADNVIMPTPPSGFATGKVAVVEALQLALPTPATRVTWQPVRVGVSADGSHGFSFGYVTQYPDTGPPTPAKYMAYWQHSAGVWRVVAYKRGRAVESPTDTTMMIAALPTQLAASRSLSNDSLQLQAELVAHEQAFSNEAQRVGLGNAFAAFGSADAVNMGGASSPHFVVGATAIANMVSGGDMTASPFIWSASSALVAPSGDLGITFGLIQVKTGAPPGSTGIPFFTIWRRDTPGSSWRYIAE